MTKPSTIVSEALARIQAPNYTAFGKTALQRVLDSLCFNHVLKLNLVTQTINIVGTQYGPFNLESDYLRTYNLSYQWGNIPIVMQQISLDEWDAKFKILGSIIPTQFATDLSPQSSGQPAKMFIYPAATQSISLQHRYMIYRAPVIFSEPIAESNVWFPYDDYLIYATAADLLDIVDRDGQRKVSFLSQAQSMLSNYLNLQGDEQRVSQTVQLSPNSFSSRSSRGRSVSTSKSDPYNILR